MVRHNISDYTLSLEGLEIAPAQVWGAIRLVPLIRHNVKGDLRLAAHKHSQSQTIVSLDGELMADGIKYVSYVPHAMVATWSDDGTPAAAWGTQMNLQKDGRKLKNIPLRVVGRMAKRLSDNQLRFLPLHLAMEGFLSLHFGGPEIVWSEYSQQAVSYGLDPRMEYTIPGKMISKLDEALRVFEIHEGQTGVLLFVADVLASAFVVPHPDDYRKLHRTLIEDFYGELLYYYSNYYKNVPTFTMSLPEIGVNSLADIRSAVEKVRQELGVFKEHMASSLFNKQLETEQVYRIGRFSLKRFMSELKLTDENHIGEFIISDTGSLEYLKTYHLSKQHAKRAYLLQQLAYAGWNLVEAAQNLNLSYKQLVERIYNAGFGFLMRWTKVQEIIREQETRKKK
jgi:hypothetical protein